LNRQFQIDYTNDTEILQKLERYSMDKEKKEVGVKLKHVVNKHQAFLL